MEFRRNNRAVCSSWANRRLFGEPETGLRPGTVCC
jgi:hypothetical protein